MTRTTLDSKLSVDLRQASETEEWAISSEERSSE
jgi:hypothetical protein